MTKLTCAILAVTGLGAMLAIRPAGAGQHDPVSQNRPGSSNGSTSNKTGLTLSAERISAEPDSHEQAETLHWSPDGARAAWMHLVYPPESAPIKTPQQEIWSFPSVQSQTGHGTSATAKSVAQQPILLLSTTQITNALRGTDTPIQPKSDQDDDDDDGNPFLLRDFAWSRDHSSLLLIGSQSLAWFDLSSGTSRILISGDDPLADAVISPDGSTVSFIRNHSLWLVDARGGPARIFAKSAGEDLREGEPDWPYRNELHLTHAYQWSPDSSRIAWFETDDRAVAKYAFRASNGDTREIVYPKPGGALPVLRAFVQPASGGVPVEVNLGPTRDFYLPRMSWLPDSRQLAIERLDRRQQALDLFLADALTGKTRLLLTEKDKYWINLSDDLHFLHDGKGFLWSSERTGFRHLYLYDMQGKQLLQVTRGDWEVTGLNAVDETHQSIYFTATEKSPLERHLYRVSLDGTGMEQITHTPGTHEIRFAPDAMSFADCYSNHASPPQIALFNADTGELPALNPHPAATSSALPPLLPVDFLTIKTHLGVETHAFLIKPAAFDPTRKYPVIVYMAGGPGEQLVRDSWGGPNGLWMQSMAEKGYIIFALDNQGTAARGHYFEEPIHLRLSAQELGDQRDGINYLRALPYADSTRLGVCGWGYGGFLVVHAMLDRPVAFKAGFAGAPIVDWHFYDAVFAERYLDDTVAHADGWDSSTAFGNRSSHFFKGAMLIAQGTEDDFVHMENTLTLQDHLLDAGKSADVLLFSDRGHIIEEPPARQLLYSRMTEFFLKNL